MTRISTLLQGISIGFHNHHVVSTAYISLRAIIKEVSTADVHEKQIVSSMLRQVYGEKKTERGFISESGDRLV
jgi:hypothetical protein